MGAGLAFLPMYLWIVTGRPQFADPAVVGVWLFAIAFLLISSLPTLSWTRMRPRKNIRLEVLALAGLVVAALLTEPWWTLAGICVIYLALIPVGLVSYARVKRQRGAVRTPASPE